MMYANERVVPLLENDYFEWHQGREQFGLWYIEIELPTIIEYCQSLQRQSQYLLNPNYQRQFHITIFVNGFWVKQKRYIDDFDNIQLMRQLDVLKQLQLSPFTLSLGKMNSFSNVLFVEILDNCQYLTKIRQALGQVSQEISPPTYCPHITLGFYCQDFLLKDIFSIIKNIDCQTLDLTVQKLTFGSYQTKQQQGKLSPIVEWGFS